MDGRGQKLVKTKPAMMAAQLRPSIDLAGDGDSMRRLPLDFRDPLFEKPVRIRSLRRVSRPVEGNDLVSAGRRIDAETVTADAG